MKLIKHLLKLLAIFIAIMILYIGFIFIKPHIFSKNNIQSVNYKNMYSQNVNLNFEVNEVNIFLFNPDCYSCNKISQKVKEIEKNKINKIYFITECTDKSLINKYISKNKLENYLNHVLIDYDLKTNNIFNLGPIVEYPTLIQIYRQEKKIINL